MKSTMLSGNDRIEMSAVLGRPMRQGTPEALSVSDTQRMRDLLEQQDGRSATEHLEYLKGMQWWMLSGCIEWAWKCVDRSEELLSASGKPESKTCHERWLRMSRGLQAAQSKDALLDVGRILQLRTRNLEAASSELFQEAQASYRLVHETIGTRSWQTASAFFEIGVARVRARHDLLICFITAAAGAVAHDCGEAEATALLHDTMASCAFYEPMWVVLEKSGPLERAAILAEHLRAHFSGRDREGSVLIVENEKEFRIQMDACGSGGALRRELAAEIPILKNASLDTWGRGGEVPVYCSHCAQNEVASLGRLGFKAWTTEFNPEANAPCHWIISKNNQPYEPSKPQ